jgi:hypothetical protein
MLTVRQKKRLAAQTKGTKFHGITAQSDGRRSGKRSTCASKRARAACCETMRNKRNETGVHNMGSPMWVTVNEREGAKPHHRGPPVASDSSCRAEATEPEQELLTALRISHAVEHSGESAVASTLERVGESSNRQGEKAQAQRHSASEHQWLTIHLVTERDEGHASRADIICIAGALCTCSACTMSVKTRARGSLEEPPLFSRKHVSAPAVGRGRWLSEQRLHLQVSIT